MKNLALVCSDYKYFPESGEMIRAANTLGVPVFNETSSLRRNFHYGTRGFFLKYQDNDIFSGQEYMYELSFLMSIFPNKRELFNDEAILTTLGRVPTEMYSLPVRHPINMNENFFIRPNSGDKQFNGQLIGRRNLQNLSTLFHCNPWELVIIAPEKKSPDEEFRFFCIKDDNDKIHMLSSRYLPDKTSIVPDAILKKAKEYAERIFDQLTIGNSFVLDLAVDEGSITIIELNSINSSGLYSVKAIDLLSLILECYNE